MTAKYVQTYRDDSENSIIKLTYIGVLVYTCKDRHIMCGVCKWGYIHVVRGVWGQVRCGKVREECAARWEPRALIRNKKEMKKCSMTLIFMDCSTLSKIHIPNFLHSLHYPCLQSQCAWFKWSFIRMATMWNLMELNSLYCITTLGRGICVQRVLKL